jgi:integrase
MRLPVLKRDEVRNLKPIRRFLESKALRSRNTSRTYLTALVHFNNFLTPATVETILPSLREGADVYELLDSFVKYQVGLNIGVKSSTLNLRAVVSYLGYHDIDIMPRRFKNKVTVPRLIRREEQAIDGNDIRELLLKCTSMRFKAYLLVLASGGMRAVEALAMRVKDVDFTVRPTRVHVRGEFSKTKTDRDIFISDEAAQALKDWIRTKIKPSNDLISRRWRLDERANPRAMYNHAADEFSKLRKLAGFDDRKDNSLRHVVTLNSFRRFAKTTISNIAGNDYAEWFLGHANSPYYTAKPGERAEIYRKCMKYLTFLDYTTLQAAGRSTEADLEAKAKEIAALRQQTQILSKQLATVIEQQQQHANTFDMKFVRLLDIVKTGLVDQDEATRSFISGEIVKMMPRKLTTKELQKIEEYRNLTGVFIDSTDSKGS